MSELQAIESALNLAARRQRWQRAWAGFWRGMFAAAALWLLTLGLYKALPLPVWAFALGGALGVATTFAGFWMGWRREPSARQMARWLDARQQLKERLSTAWELSSTSNTSAWRDIVMADAAKQVRELDIRELLPFHLPAASRWALLLLAVGAGLAFVPEYRSPAFRQRQRDREIVRQTGEQIAAFVRHSLEERPPALESTHHLLDAVSELGDQFTKQNLTRADALKDLANAVEKLKDQSRQMENDPLLKRLPLAARAPAAESGDGSGALQKQIEAMQNALGNQAGNADPLQKLKQALEKQADEAKKLADKPGNLSDAERQQMSRALSELAEQARQLGLQLPELEAAMAALAEGNTGVFLRDLQASLTDLGRIADMARALQQLQQQQAEQLGKDLAEQLQRGQMNAAAATLEKMAQQLQSSTLSAEQKQKILNEISKAISPANQYGGVGEMLKQSELQLQSSQNLGAAKALDAAAGELRKMSEYLSDSHTLKAATEALQRAQLAMAAAQGLGSLGPIRAGPGGKPGRGVGTWADEQDDWLLPPKPSGRWDNTGVERSDTTPKGETDRGDGQLADNVQATKIRGQFSPGAAMPSITLKGLSAKGQSTVAYEEAVAAAQSEAQSALNQEKVPRAYQGAVKDYFNDLKK